MPPIEIGLRRDAALDEPVIVALQTILEDLPGRDVDGACTPTTAARIR
ncbi:hypothetical protein [Baekduia alba]|nr:hypothetical protein [Baekduia alba]